MGKIKGFLFAVRHREILMTDLGSTRPGTPTLQSRSCILHILFHWGKEHNRHFRTFLPFVQRKSLQIAVKDWYFVHKRLSKSPTRGAPLLQEDSPKCRQASYPLSKEVLLTVSTFRFIAPNNFLVRQSEAIGSRKSRWPALS